MPHSGLFDPSEYRGEVAKASSTPSDLTEALALDRETTLVLAEDWLPAGKVYVHDPARHTVSEYARTGSAAVITVAFIAWALSLIASAAVVLKEPAESRLVSVVLLLAAGGMLLVATFRTQTSAGRFAYGDAFTIGGRLHDAGSGLTTVAFLVAAGLAARKRRPTSVSRCLGGAVALAVVVQLTLLAVGPEVAGIRQRVLIVIGLGAQALMIHPTSPSNGT